jgi:hypothetical protein
MSLEKEYSWGSFLGAKMGEGGVAMRCSSSLHNTVQCIPMQSDRQKFSDIAISSRYAMRAAPQHPTLGGTTLRYSQVWAPPYSSPQAKQKPRIPHTTTNISFLPSLPSPVASERSAAQAGRRNE